jgi:hypothetical protein
VYWRLFPQGKGGQSMKIGTNERLRIHGYILSYTFTVQSVIKYQDRNLPLPLPFFQVVNNVPDTYTFLALAVIYFSEKFSLVFECHHLKKTEFVCFIAVECISLYPVKNVFIPTSF